MTIQFSTGLVNAMLDGQVNGGAGASAFDSGLLNIYTGSAPATADAAVTGTLLASMTLPADAFAAAASKACAKAGTWSDSSANNTGTAGYFRIVTSSDDGTSSTTQKRIQGTCGQGSGDMNLDNTSIASGQTVTVTSCSIGIT